MLGGKKNDAEKPRMDLLPPEALIEIARALTFGAKKYGDHNWRDGMLWSRYYAAALRHLNEWNNGSDRDPETGLSHLAHAGACIVFLIASQVSELGKDDRWKKLREPPR